LPVGNFPDHSCGVKRRLVAARKVVDSILGYIVQACVVQIGEISKRGRVSVQTIRYYERYGLLRPPERRPSRYRVYSESDLRRLQFILHAKTRGFTLEEIKHVLELREKQACPCGEVRRIGEDRLTQLERQIAELTTFRNQLARAVSQWRKCPEIAPAGDAICVLIEQSMTQVQSATGSLEGKKTKRISSKAKSTSVIVTHVIFTTYRECEHRRIAFVMS